jgi:hypothetical protein
VNILEVPERSAKVIQADMVIMVQAPDFPILDLIQHLAPHMPAAGEEVPVDEEAVESAIALSVREDLE